MQRNDANAEDATPNRSKADQDQPTATDQHMSTALFATVVAVVGLVLVAAAFFIASRVMNGSSGDPCSDSKQDILALIDRVGDAARLDEVPSDSRLLTGYGENLRNACSFNETMDFETTVVFPWLGFNPAEAPAPTGTGE